MLLDFLKTMTSINQAFVQDGNDEDLYSIPMESIRAAYNPGNSQSLYDELNTSRKETNVSAISIISKENFDDLEQEKPLTSRSTMMATTSNIENQEPFMFIKTNNRAIEELIRVQDKVTNQLTRQAEQENWSQIGINQPNPSRIPTAIHNSLQDSHPIPTRPGLIQCPRRILVFTLNESSISHESQNLCGCCNRHRCRCCCRCTIL
ncbi:hypothetical protein CHUAL_010123 [Chamberlinius hualienensis]